MTTIFETMAQVVIDKANAGYHDDAANYPPFALSSSDDRVRWSNYIRGIIADLHSPEMADKIIDLAETAYRRNDQRYPPFAVAPWDDRIRWSGYLKTLAAECFAEQVGA